MKWLADVRLYDTFHPYRGNSESTESIIEPDINCNNSTSNYNTLQTANDDSLQTNNNNSESCIGILADKYDSIRQQRFYNRKEIAALNYEINHKSFIPPFPSMKLKYLTLFLRISFNHDKVEDFQPIVNSL